MLVEFNQLPDHARFWIFTSNRFLTQEEVASLNNELSLFVQKWTAHKQDLNASFSLMDDAILVVGVDESQTGASGCSIDSMTKEIVRLSQQMNIDWFSAICDSGQTREIKTFMCIRHNNERKK
jgi:hypothetical protein